MEYLIILMVCSEQMHADISFLIPSEVKLIEYQAKLIVCTDEMGVDSKLETKYWLMLID